MQRKHGVIVLIFSENPFLWVNIIIKSIIFQLEHAIIVLDYLSHIYDYLELFCVLCATFYSLTVA